MSESLTKTVLIVDDTADIVDLFSVFVKACGCKTVTASDGSEAVEKAQRYKPDLILMDLRMPVMDGYEATQRILAIPELAATPVIAVSAHCINARERSLQAGCRECVPKPTEPETLQELLNKYVGGC